MYKALSGHIDVREVERSFMPLSVQARIQRLSPGAVARMRA